MCHDLGLSCLPEAGSTAEAFCEWILICLWSLNLPLLWGGVCWFVLAVHCCRINGIISFNRLIPRPLQCLRRCQGWAGNRRFRVKKDLSLLGATTVASTELSCESAEWLWRKQEPCSLNAQMLLLTALYDLLLKMATKSFHFKLLWDRRYLQNLLVTSEVSLDFKDQQITTSGCRCEEGTCLSVTIL